MANTTVTDALYMANVTQVNAIESSKKLQAEGMSFSQAMGDASLQNRKVDMTSEDTGIKAGARTTVESGAREIKSDSGKSKEAETETTAAKTDKMEAAAKDTVKKADDIKGDIKEKLQVTDEDIENAMETLGLTIQDLFNPQQLQELMMKLAGCEDSLDLLTNADLYSGMQEILSDVADIANTIIEENGITAEDFEQLLGNGEIFERVINEMATTQSGDTSFGPIMENEAFQAEVPGIAPENTGVQSSQRRDEEKSDGEQHINVTVTRDNNEAASAVSKTETFRNISQTEKTQSNNEGMENMTQTTTTVTVNELGDVVETVERFSSAFSDANEIVSQVTETIKLNIAQDTTSMEMMLHPATLGTVNMQISSNNGVITANILVQNEAVKAALESSLATLIESFEEQGRTVEAVEVSVANYNLDKGMQQNTRDEQERENAFRMGRGARRRLRLDDISDDDMDELEDDEKLAADMMRRQGNSLDYMA